MKQPSRKAIVIGSGVAGMAVAIRLAVQGYQVEVLEANSYPGGKLTEIRAGGFRFDAGPSLFTMPHLVDELFALAGEDPRQHFQYQKLDEITRYFYEDGTRFNTYADKQRTATEIETTTGEPAGKLLNHLYKVAERYGLTSHIFMESSLQQLDTYLSGKSLTSLLNLHKIDTFRTMHKANAATFKDGRVVQLFDRYATYNGSDPYLAPATLNVIPHLEFNMGAYFPVGGMHSITKALVALGERVGVRYRLNTPVSKILLKGHRAVGVTTANGEEYADIVVSNMDVVNTYRKLLPQTKAPERIINQPRSTSTIIFYWGMDKVFEQLGVHNIFFAKDYQEEFRHLSELKSVWNDPTVYVHISSKLEAADAPEDKESWFVMVNVPPNTGQDWKAMKQTVKKQVVQKLSRMLGEDIGPLIVAEDMLDPVLIEQRTSSYQGSLYGGSSNNMMAAFLRQPNFHGSIKGLYFSGGSAHPGGGIPLCLLSARITAGLIEKREP